MIQKIYEASIKECKRQETKDFISNLFKKKEDLKIDCEMTFAEIDIEKKNMVGKYTITFNLVE